MQGVEKCFRCYRLVIEYIIDEEAVCEIRSTSSIAWLLISQQLLSYTESHERGEMDPVYMSDILAQTIITRHRRNASNHARSCSKGV